ncbi:MAG: TetM/TetW/TetO/TetS family tetracycline resistance ribosomal protection protein [Lachnospiraceae bacterium]|nr:TetM/TetW/TetO/TetS family tetracycline resistance ribosomal protection protein [Lachnospiraceae bacterium]
MATTEHRVIGILAHVDAGKTTLSEALLYRTAMIRKLGRVDNRDSFLDTDAMERARGITIYSKQTRFIAHAPEGDITYTLLDTPGHADFSPEMERTLRVLDLAILVVSAADGVNGQVRTLWGLLQHYGVPAVIFVNKMDQAENLGGTAEVREALLSDMKAKLGDGVLPFDEWEDPDMQENLALLDEELFERFMEGDPVTAADLQALTARKLYTPVLFGSALKLEGVDELIEALNVCGQAPTFGDDFGARIFKITRDENGERLTHMRITGGAIAVRQELTFENDEGPVTEKINQIRRYSGEKYDQLDKALAGEVCTVTGLTGTYAGQGLGFEEQADDGLMRPVLTWQLRLRQGEDAFAAYRKLRELSEEEPMLAVNYDERLKKITVRMMGQIQREILADLAMKRFGLEIAFEQPSVIYKETIAEPVIGIGHFEPLRHYAEVHLLLEPGERGSGITFDSKCSVDVLSRNWQRLIISYLSGKRLKGVLTGSDLTDVKISVIAGRAHEKHTEGGDFPQASRRAVRQGLMNAANVLLEPWYDFRIELPQGSLGHLLTDMTKRQADMKAPEFEGDRAVLTGSVAVSQLADYADELASYTKGEGRIEVKVGEYRPCPDPQSIIEKIGYDPDADTRNPSGSVFCEHGAGTVIPWYQVPEMAHVDSGYSVARAPREYTGDMSGALYVSGLKADRSDMLTVTGGERTVGVSRAGMAGRKEPTYDERERQIRAAEDELVAIFERTYGPIKSKLHHPDNERKVLKASAPAAPVKPRYAKPKTEGPVPEFLLVDGYNVIFDWENLRDLTELDVKAARDRLKDILSNYAGFRKTRVILIFDAYKVSGGKESVMTYHNISVIFTKEAETADQYIEKAARDLTSKKYRVTVATSDAVEQLIIFGAGARRMSARELLEEIIRTENDIRENFLETQQGGRYFLQNNLAEKLSGIKLEAEDNAEG